MHVTTVLLIAASLFAISSGYIRSTFQSRFFSPAFNGDVVNKQEDGGILAAMASSPPQSSNSLAKANTIAFIKTVLVVGTGISATAALAAEDTPLLSRADVGFIDLNTTEPMVTDIAFFDIEIGDDVIPVKERVEISLYGTVCPKTVENFKLLCSNTAKVAGEDEAFGYKGSELFRVITSFSVQGGNIGAPKDIEASRKGRFGRSAINNAEGFEQENFRILHSYKGAGVVSMMKDLLKKGKQDSRFFVTFSPYASWADDKYTAFGRVSKGMQFLQSLQIVPVQSPANYPLTKLRIVDSGILPQNS